MVTDIRCPHCTAVVATLGPREPVAAAGGAVKAEHWRGRCPECGAVVRYPPPKKRKTMEEIKEAWSAKQTTKH